MCLSVNPQPQLWPSRTGLTETRGSDGALEGAGLFMAGPRACTDSQYVRRSNPKALFLTHPLVIWV